VLGQLVEYESHFDRFRTVASDTWKEEEGEHAGVLYNLGSHLVDQAVVLFGLPEAVTAHLRKVRPGSRIYDYFDIRLHYPSFAALLKCSYLVKEEGPRYALHGTNGSFLKWGIDPQEEVLKTATLPLGEEWGKEPEIKWGLLNALSNKTDAIVRVPTVPGNYTPFYTNLYEAVRLGVPLSVKAEEARNGIRILELCLESHYSRKTIEVAG
jgi:predicted dehydrogenase